MRLPRTARLPLEGVKILTSPRILFPFRKPPVSSPAAPAALYPGLGRFNLTSGTNGAKYFQSIGFHRIHTVFALKASAIETPPSLNDIPQGTEILRCIQCGTCSASCPLTDQMDYAPRALFALMRDEDMETALASNTAWFCVSCYQCMVRCPQQIPITDLMYRLKQLAQERGHTPESHRMPDLYRAFKRIMDRDGRISEALVMALYGVKHPKAALESTLLGLALLKRNRLELVPRKIGSAHGLMDRLKGLTRRKEKS